MPGSQERARKHQEIVTGINKKIGVSSGEQRARLAKQRASLERHLSAQAPIDQLIHEGIPGIRLVLASE